MGKHPALKSEHERGDMMRYIALLRGVNVGGKNKLPMPELRKSFEENGFTEVSSYINSGNVLFKSAQSDIFSIQGRCEALIKADFGLDIPAAVISAEALAGALAHAPVWWNADRDSKHNAIFVIAPATAAEICELVGETKPEYEQAAFHGPVIFWSAPIATFSRTRWSKVAGSSAYSSITIRNANTACKLGELVKQEISAISGEAVSG